MLKKGRLSDLPERVLTVVEPIEGHNQRLAVGQIDPRVLRE